jgi:hypothetical protein
MEGATFKRPQNLPRYFDAGETKMTEEMEAKFLDATFIRGDRILFNVGPENFGSGWLAWEVDYLESLGYVLQETADGWAMVI